MTRIYARTPRSPVALYYEVVERDADMYLLRPAMLDEEPTWYRRWDFQILPDPGTRTLPSSGNIRPRSAKAIGEVMDEYDPSRDLKARAARNDR